MKKWIALVLVFVFAAGIFAGCGNNTPDLSYAITATRNGSTERFPVGPYRYYVQWWNDSYYANLTTIAAQMQQNMDWKTMLADTSLTAPQTLSEYIVSMAKDQYLSWLYIDCMFDELGLEWTEEDRKSIEKIIQDDWIAVYGNDGFNTIRLKLGVTYDEFCSLMAGNRKSGKIVNYYYGENGPYEISDAEKHSYFENNYARFKYIVMMLKDSDGNELGEDAVGTVEANRDEILASDLPFEDLIKQYSNDYVSDLDSLTDAQRTAAEKQNQTILEDGLVTNAEGVFDSALATYYNVTLDSKVVNQVFSMQEGEVAAVTIDDSIWVVKKYSVTEKESYYEDAETSVFQALYQDDLRAKYTAWTAGLNYTFNQAVVDAYKPENLEDLFRFASTKS